MKAKWRDREFEITRVGTNDGYLYDLSDVELLDTPYYWEELKHQYAGMAMQVLIAEYRKTQGKYGLSENLIQETCAKESIEFATALVEKLKEKEERK